MDGAQETRKIMGAFFRCMGIGFVVSSFRNVFSDIVPIETLLKNLLLTFAYNFIIGIWFGLANMFIIFFYLKKIKQ